jgi:hypothetical protein
LDNISTHYKDYDPSNFGEIAFIPAVKDKTSCLETPKGVSSYHIKFMSLVELSQVCSNSEWATLGFSVTSQNLPADALAKLKIRQHPLTSRIVALLEKSPPKDGAEAKSWFDILSGRIHGSIHFMQITFTAVI